MMVRGGMNRWRPSFRSVRAVGILLVLGSIWAGAPVRGDGVSSGAGSLGRPGYLVIEAARDSSAGFHWESCDGQRSLVWDQGRLTVPDSLAVEDIGRSDIGVSFTADLAGAGSSGQLVLRDGIYPVSEAVVLSDHRMEMRISGGELEVRGASIRYRRVKGGSREFRSGLLLLAGMTLLVIVLLRRARLKTGERTGS